VQRNAPDPGRAAGAPVPRAPIHPGPDVRADRVVFRLEDRGYAAVRLQQELERPRSGPPFQRRDGVWELAYRRPQVDRMEYRFEADGEAFCDPHNPRRTPGSFGERSVIEFPGYVPPPWLGAPDPAPPRQLEPRIRLWSPPDTDPRRPLPLLTVHDGTDYERLAQLPKLIAHAIASNRIPACRVALLDPAERDEDYSASARYARTLAATLPRLAPATAHAGLGASLGALALMHARWLHPGAFGALMLQSGSFFRQRWDRQESGFLRFRRISRFVGAVLQGGRAATPIRITLTCGAAEENLANNRAASAALRRQGHAAALHVNRDAHNYVGWRDTLDPHLVDLLARAWG
jgi:enterochelin esterase family protein